MAQERERRLGVWEKYLSLWVALCIGAGIGKVFPKISDVLGGLTVANWAVKPFTMAFFAWLFMGVVSKGFLLPEIAQEYRAGMILLGVAPCTAMVLMWSYLAQGDMGHTLVMTAINSTCSKDNIQWLK